MDKRHPAGRLKFFRTHIEMFIPKPDYETVVAFVVGMNHQSDGRMLDGFEAWLQNKFGKYSKFYWAEIIRRQFVDASNIRNDLSDVDFLLNLVEQFLAEHQQV